MRNGAAMREYDGLQTISRLPALRAHVRRAHVDVPFDLDISLVIVTSPLSPTRVGLVP